MKAKLIYNLPDDWNDFRLTLHAQDFFGALCNIDNVCRSILKGDIGAKDGDIEHIRQIIADTSGFYDIE